MAGNPIVEQAKEHYKIAVEGWQDIYDEASKDLQFVYDVGEGQWPSGVKEARGDRPCITVNKLQKFIRQIRGDAMQNRPRIKVIPVDDQADVRMAEIYNGIIRSIEYQSNAEIAYDTAYGHAIASSIGFFRLITKYADDNGFDQDIFIKRVLDPFSIHFDPSAKEFTLEDARYCFVEESISKKEYERLYGKDATAPNWEANKQLFGDWLTDDRIRIAEYFYKDPVKKKIAQLDNGDVIEITKEITPEFIQAQGFKILRDRTVDTHIVKWCKMNGAEILEESEWPGLHIPIIPVFGDEIIAGGKKYYLSLARGAKGPQQMYNYWATSATETVALAPKNPFIVDHRQVKGFEREWEEANIKNRMFIRYNAVAGLNKPSKEPQSQVPSAIVTMMQTTAFDIEDHLGRYEASQGRASNERSGKAIAARVAQADKGTYTFVDNMTRAIIYAGKQIIDLIPKVYDTQRALRIMGDTGEPTSVPVNVPAMDPNTGEMGVVNDLSVGKFDLIASQGASFGSKREEMVTMLTESMQYAPTLANVIAPLIFKFSDWPGAQEAYQEIKKEVEMQQQMAMTQGGAAGPVQ
jgi:hypothetical protein